MVQKENKLLSKMLKVHEIEETNFLIQINYVFLKQNNLEFLN